MKAITQANGNASLIQDERVISFDIDSGSLSEFYAVDANFAENMVAVCVKLGHDDFAMYIFNHDGYQMAFEIDGALYAKFASATSLPADLCALVKTSPATRLPIDNRPFYYKFF